MSYAATAPQGIDLRAIAASVAPGRINIDPLGFVSGYKAYQIYTALAAKSDAELVSMGIKRIDLPRVAMRAVQEVKND